MCEIDPVECEKLADTPCTFSAMNASVQRLEGKFRRAHHNAIRRGLSHRRVVKWEHAKDKLARRYVHLLWHEACATQVHWGALPPGKSATVNVSALGDMAISVDINYMAERLPQQLVIDASIDSSGAVVTDSIPR